MVYYSNAVLKVILNACTENLESLWFRAKIRAYFSLM